MTGLYSEKTGKANIACKEAIETAISEHYRLGPEAVRQVAEQFGFDRTLYVLANTVRQKAHLPRQQGVGDHHPGL